MHTHNSEPTFAHPVFSPPTGHWLLSLRCPARHQGTPKELGTGLGHSFLEEGRGPTQGPSAVSWGPRTSGARLAAGAGPPPHAVGSGQAVVGGAPCRGRGGGPGLAGGRARSPGGGLENPPTHSEESAHLPRGLRYLISDPENSPVNNCFVFVWDRYKVFEFLSNKKIMCRKHTTLFRGVWRHRGCCLVLRPAGVPSASPVGCGSCLFRGLPATWGSGGRGQAGRLPPRTEVSLLTFHFFILTHSFLYGQ